MFVWPLPMKAILLSLLLGSSACCAADGGFLFVTFKGEQSPMTEQIHFGLSKDGRTWEALNAGEPVLVSRLGEKGVRDPYLLRTHDGSGFVLIATDLSINLNHDWGRAVRGGSKSIVVWTSRDLVDWSQPRLEKVAPDDAGCTWAPEAVFDEESKDYLVFWASTTKSDAFAKHRIWGARTKDFKTFGKPFIYIEKPNTVIDTTIVRDGGKYYRFTKDEKFKAITMESSDKIMGPWTDLPGFSLAQMKGYEGPECYQVAAAAAGQPATWCLILDYYSKGQGYQPYVTTDLAKGQFTAGQGFTFPFHFRHGSIQPLSQTEYEKVEKAWKKQAQK